MQSIRYGLRLSEWNDKLTEEEGELAARIDIWKVAEPDSAESIIDMTVDDMKLALVAIRRNRAFEIRNQGVLYNQETVATESAVPVIEAFVETT
ncbi:hypothetical protein HYU82_02720 [Candidatus Saccharibacteria bacterium]|nr:hypothetical protein [Candidatus Saccharibacteria bacterium]